MGGRFSGASFWTGPFLVGLAVILGLGLGGVFYFLEGWPGDHDEYGEVAIPGAVVLKLPEDQVRLNFENHATQSGDTTSVDDQPEGLAGLKPTVGLVSRTGIIPISVSQDTAGPMGRTVADVALLMNALPAVDDADPALRIFGQDEVARWLERSPDLRALASAMRKVLPPALLEEVLAHLDPLTPFVAVLRSVEP